jgi:1-acyl-sn-glycerol-3-phosphate acyltransferase
MQTTAHGLRVVRCKNGCVEASFPDVPSALFGAEGVLSILFGLCISHYIAWPLILAAVLAACWSTTVGVVFAACVVVYLVSFLDGAETRTGRPWHAFRLHGCWRLSWRYLQLRLVRTTPLVGKAPQFVFGFHPHGLLILSRIATYGGAWEALFPGVETRALGASAMFRIPLVREICLALGAVDAGLRSARAVLSAGLSAIVYPGGIQEMLRTDGAKPDELYLYRRKGFIRLALQSGASLVPVYVFGEKFMYQRVFLPTKPAAVLRRFGIPLVLFFGRWGTLLPQRHKLLVVVGAPIAVTKTAEPTAEAVDALHAQYVAELRMLYEKWREEAGYGDAPLVIE